MGSEGKAKCFVVRNWHTITCSQSYEPHVLAKLVISQAGKFPICSSPTWYQQHLALYSIAMLIMYFSARYSDLFEGVW